ncbi:MAG: hypothetical protein FJX11_15615 [Alphaproteobacteria bacterium]|nr:hypothetical protein [Alphaproteobacteria bacterium]
MRLLIASMAAALAAVAFAAPAYAQDDNAPAPVPTAKPKPGTAAYCQSLKTSSARSACLKKISARSAPKAAPTTTAKKTKKTTPTTTPKQPDVGQLAPPAAVPSSGGAVAVPPLPQKTI